METNLPTPMTARVDMLIYQRVNQFKSALLMVQRRDVSWVTSGWIQWAKREAHLILRIAPWAKHTLHKLVAWQQKTTAENIWFHGNEIHQVKNQLFYPLVKPTKFAIENGHWYIVSFPMNSMVDLSIAMLKYQSYYQVILISNSISICDRLSFSSCRNNLAADHLKCHCHPGPGYQRAGRRFPSADFSEIKEVTGPAGPDHFSSYQGFHKWYPNSWMVYNGKSQTNSWMITRATPILGNLHMMNLVI